MHRLLPLCLFLPWFGSALASEPSCEPIDGVAPLLEPGRIVLLGELHGTQESPAFALDVACHAARAGLPVLVGLEQRSDMQSAVDTFLASEGTARDRAALAAGGQWQADYQDGRTSEAMLDLIDGLRQLRSDGHDVRIVLFDETGAGGGQQRERAMAANLAATAGSATKALTVVLTGNLHSRTSVGSSRDAGYEPMGYLLGKATSLDRIVALNVAHGDGSAWVCTPECGVTGLGGQHGERKWAVEIDDETRPAGHQGWYHVGPLEASPPVRFTAEERAAAASRVDELRRAAAAPRDERPRKPAASRAKADDSPLSEAETKLQGNWQAFDYGSQNKTWRISFDGRKFHAAGGSDEWYAGHIVMRPEEDPPHLDFAIEDCRCSYVHQTSRAIYGWEGEHLILLAPAPGSERPAKLAKAGGTTMRLERLAAD